MMGFPEQEKPQAPLPLDFSECFAGPKPFRSTIIIEVFVVAAMRRDYLSTRAHMKKSRFFSILIVFLLLAGSIPSFAAELPYAKIKSLYKEGEFEQIRVSLEDFLKKSGKSAEPKEKIFAYKYLGVIYAAEPEGYPLAETYFYQMLKLAPNAHLSDMYVSSAIENVFTKTQVRFQKENRDNSEFDEFGNPRKPTESGTAIAPIRDEPKGPRPLKSDSPKPRRPAPEKQSSIRAWPWVLGAGVILAVGGYLWFAGQEKPKKDPPIVDGGKV